MENRTDKKYEAYLRLRGKLDLSMSSVSGNEFKLLVFILSRSLGKGQETIKLSLSEFYNEGLEGIGETGLSKSSVIRCIASLTKRGLICRTEGVSKAGHIYCINSNAINGLTAE